MAEKLKPGDRVYVDDPGLAQLRALMRSFGETPKPNHHGTVEEVYDDTVLIYFDDGAGAPYPSSATHLLPEPSDG
jgi:hypothetical protein